MHQLSIILVSPLCSIYLCKVAYVAGLNSFLFPTDFQSQQINNDFIKKDKTKDTKYMETASPGQPWSTY